MHEECRARGEVVLKDEVASQLNILLAVARAGFKKDGEIRQSGLRGKGALEDSGKNLRFGERGKRSGTLTEERCGDLSEGCC